MAQARCCWARDSGWGKGDGDKIQGGIQINHSSSPAYLSICDTGFTCLGEWESMMQGMFSKVWSSGHRHQNRVCFEIQIPGSLNLNLWGVGLRICFFIISSPPSAGWLLCQGRFENLCCSSMNSTVKLRQSGFMVPAFLQAICVSVLPSLGLDHGSTKYFEIIINLHAVLRNNTHTQFSPMVTFFFL